MSRQTQTPNAPQERELKRLVVGEPPVLFGVATLAGFELRFSHLEFQRNEYWDSPAQDLGRCGVALRFRFVQTSPDPNQAAWPETPARVLVAFKGPALGGEEDAGVHSREELEVLSLAGEIPQAVSARVAALVALESLGPRFVLRTRRAVWDVVGVGELCLDRVEVLDGAGQVVLRFCELELESNAPLDVLQNCANAVQHLMPPGSVLEVSSLNKLARAKKAVQARP